MQKSFGKKKTGRNTQKNMKEECLLGRKKIFIEITSLEPKLEIYHWSLDFYQKELKQSFGKESIIGEKFILKLEKLELDLDLP